MPPPGVTAPPRHRLAIKRQRKPRTQNRLFSYPRLPTLVGAVYRYTYTHHLSFALSFHSPVSASRFLSPPPYLPPPSYYRQVLFPLYLSLYPLNPGAGSRPPPERRLPRALTDATPRLPPFSASGNTQRRFINAILKRLRHRMTSSKPFTSKSYYRREKKRTHNPLNILRQYFTLNRSLRRIIYNCT